jgi:hypothetical protein
MLDSLVRVSRRVDKKHFVRVPQSHDSKTSPYRSRSLSHATKEAWLAHGYKYQQANTASHRFHFSNFRYYLTLFSKFFASFPHGTCSLSVSHLYLALDGIYHPLRAAIPNNSTLRKPVVHLSFQTWTGLSPSTALCSKRLYPKLKADLASPDYNSEDFQSELFPLHSPLLRESLLVSFPPPSYMLKFSGYSWLIGGSIEKYLIQSLNAKTGNAIQVLDTLTSRSLVMTTRDRILIVIHLHSILSCDRSGGLHLLRIVRNGVDGGDEQALQQTYSPKGSASCVQSFDDSLVLQFAWRIAFRCVLHRHGSQDIRCWKCFFINFW